VWARGFRASSRRGSSTSAAESVALVARSQDGDQRFFDVVAGRGANEQIGDVPVVGRQQPGTGFPVPVEDPSREQERRSLVRLAEAWARATRKASTAAA